MISSIISPLLQTTTILQWPNFTNTIERVESNVNNLINYKKQKALWIDSASALVTFIELLPKSGIAQDYEKLDQIYTQAVALANRISMATVNNKGNPIDGSIFNGRSKEQWIAVLENPNRSFNPLAIKPIRCVWHPFTSLNFWMDESVLDYSPMVSFFIVDLVGLSLSVNKFYKTNESFSSKEYIGQVIYPSLVEDVANITLFNRLNNIFLEQSEVNVYDKKRLSPTWYDLCDPIDNAYTKIVEDIARQNEGIDFIAQNIPLLGKTTLSHFLSNLPPVPSVKTIFSLALCALCPYLNFILYFNKVIYGVENRTFTNALKIQLMIMKNDKSLLSDNEQLENQQLSEFTRMNEWL